MSLDIIAALPTATAGGRKFLKLINVYANTGDGVGPYAATLDQYYDLDEECGYGETPDEAIADLREQVLDVRLSGKQLAALEGWLTHCIKDRPEDEKAGWKACMAEVLEMFE